MVQRRRCILLVVLTVVSGAGPQSVAQQGGESTVLWQFEAGG
jgi:hypothetical protein